MCEINKRRVGMKSKFTKYFVSLEMDSFAQQRAGAVIEVCQKWLQMDIAEVFVSEYLDEGGNRVYEHFWMFTERCGLEARNFLRSDNLDCVVLSKNVGRWKYEKKDYDFVKSRPTSRLTVNFNLPSALASMRASKQNCDRLRDIFKKYIAPNIAPVVGVQGLEQKF
jgi:hypothetical protein